jgi:mono/diheme cytochrome c family protein
MKHRGEPDPPPRPLRKRLLVVAAIVVLALVAWAAVTLMWQAPIAPVPPLSRASFTADRIVWGEQLALIGNCSGCHTARDGAPYAGGLPMETPFGTVMGSNLTPDAETGIGLWSEAAFVRAMREGIGRNGQQLYPVFPYDHFTRLTDADLSALYAFLMTRTPVHAEEPPNRMKFPFGWRRLIAGWNLLFLDEEPFEADAIQGERYNRGAYLVEALAHCGSCHTSRNVLGAARRGKEFDGAVVEGWYAPPLNEDNPSPVPWTVEQLTQYLRTGIARDHAIAAGPMQSVVASLAQAREADVAAIALYVATKMGSYSEARLQHALTSLRRAARPLAGAPVPAGDAQMALGAAVYASTCAGCHDLGRTQSSNGALRLPLAVAVYDADPRSLLRIVREGVIPEEGSAGRWMPGFGTTLTDEQLTALAAYLRRTAAGMPPWPELAKAVKESHSP